MTFREWVADSRERFRRDPPVTAAKKSALKFMHGVERRTVDFIGDPIWQWQGGDWDVCIVLDACRVDLLQEVAGEYEFLPADIGAEWSCASCSADWIWEHCQTAPTPWTTGMVTANPFSSYTCGWRDEPPAIDQFGHVRELWKDHWREVSGIRTVPPEDMAAATVRTWRDRDAHGIDQLVAHWMQPHQPFRSRPEWWSGDGNLANLVDDEWEADICIWQETRRGRFDADDVWDAYRDNLRWALDELARVVENIDGRVLVTADHGNAMGEWGTWAHPPGTVVPTVRRVPAVWLDCTDAATWRPEPLGEAASVDATVEERLEALGYA